MSGDDQVRVQVIHAGRTMVDARVAVLDEAGKAALAELVAAGLRAGGEAEQARGDGA